MILYTSVQLIGQTGRSTRAACTVQGKINAVDGTNLCGPVGSTWKQFRIRRISKATLEKSRFTGIISSPEGIVCRDKKRASEKDALNISRLPHLLIDRTHLSEWKEETEMESRCQVYRHWREEVGSGRNTLYHVQDDDGQHQMPFRVSRRK